MVALTAMASKACGLHEWLVKNRPDCPELVNAQVNEGDVIRGTKGMWMEDGRFIYLEGLTPVDPEDWAHHPESDAKYMAQYLHPLCREYRDFGIRGNHDGMDYLVLRAFVESVQNGTEPPIDVYDAAAWMSVTALSEASIAAGSAPMAIPDFTMGRWVMPRSSASRIEFEY